MVVEKGPLGPVLEEQRRWDKAIEQIRVLKFKSTVIMLRRIQGCMEKT